jgi:hypothetical protein
MALYYYMMVLIWINQREGLDLSKLGYLKGLQEEFNLKLTKKKRGKHTGFLEELEEGTKTIKQRNGG